MHAQLAQVDAVSAARLHPSDSQRIQRAMEVYRISGLPLSSFHRNKLPTDKLVTESSSPSMLISLEPQDRAWLHQRIALRFEDMLQSGLIAEVSALRTRGDLHADLPSMRCVGYRQVWEYLDVPQSNAARALSELRDKGIFATRQLAKRQITWLRSMPQRRIVASDAPDALSQVLALAREFISAAPSGNQP
jgi:tRNA dimethylallyltransferase